MTTQELFQRTIADFDLFDDPYFSLFFGDEHKIPLAQLFARTIVEDDEIVIRTAEVERSVQNLLGRSIRMDVMAVDDRCSTYNVEFQRDSAGASPHRARLHSSIIDAGLALKGVRTDRIVMPRTYVIFITERDVLGGGLPSYHINRVIEETGAPFNDGSHIIYVNGAHKDTSTPLGRLIHDLTCKDAARMLTPALMERTRELKETSEGVIKMNVALEMIKTEAYGSGRQDGRQEGRLEGRQEGMLSTLFGLVRGGHLGADIASAQAGLTLSAFQAKMAEYEARPQA